MAFAATVLLSFSRGRGVAIAAVAATAGFPLLFVAVGCCPHVLLAVLAVTFLFFFLFFFVLSSLKPTIETLKDLTRLANVAELSGLVELLLKCIRSDQPDVVESLWACAALKSEQYCPHSL